MGSRLLMMFKLDVEGRTVEMIGRAVVVGMFSCWRYNVDPSPRLIKSSVSINENASAGSTGRGLVMTRGSCSIGTTLLLLFLTDNIDVVSLQLNGDIVHEGVGRRQWNRWWGRQFGLVHNN